MKLHKFSLIYLFCIYLFNCVNGHEYHGLDDTVLFKLNWAGDSIENTLKPSSDQEELIVKTSRNEKYKCYLPNLQKKELHSGELYDGPTPIELITPLFNQNLCSFRLESYWTYEICHGRYIRQFHEDREGKKVKIQEYYLGKWDKNEQTKAVEHMKQQIAKNKLKEQQPLTKRIDGAQLPYFEVIMDGGTVCDLSNKPRVTKILYVCVRHSKHDVYSLKETSTCEYEVIVLTPLLCTHPVYKPKETEENAIDCVPLDDGPKKPHSLLAMELESLKLRQQSKLNEDKKKKVYAVFKVDKNAEGGETRVRVEIRPFEELEEASSTEKLTSVEKLTKTPPKIDTDMTTSPVEDFLSGKNCLNGGSGWWKYDFCYGRYVEQYHIEKDGSKTSLNLGNFDLNTHLQWLEKNPHKRPKPLAQRKQLSHFYSDGTVCDKTGKARQTEVKLKCLENAASLSTVQLYLLEPKYCEYILGVESPLICDIIGRADENGLVEIKSTRRLQDNDDLKNKKTNSENSINDVINE